jgi:prepilin-type N-terminal cleavage/methylation domain-containing protein
MSSAKASGSSAGIGSMKTNSKRAFTFLELIIVIAVSASVFALFVLPSLARSKTRSPAAGCLSNLRQLMAAWQMYADENGGRFMFNAPAGAANTKTWCVGTVDWALSPSNTNKCPGDVLPSQLGPRVRSYSMNSQVGPPSASYTYGGSQNFSGLHTYSKEADITCPQPNGLFVFCDEDPCSMDDAYFQVPGSASVFPNVPASYLDGGCGFGFTDGHGEVHRWQGRTLPLPVVYGLSRTSVSTFPTDPDYLWLKGKAGCP